MEATDENTKLLKRDVAPAGQLRLNWLSNWTFWWIASSIRKGYSRPLESKDIYDILPEYSARKNAVRLRRQDGTPSPSTKASNPSGARLFLQVLRAYAACTVHLLVVFCLQETVRLCQPLLLGQLLDYINNDVTSDRMGYCYGGLLVLSTFGSVFIILHSYYMAELFGMRIRAAYSCLIYKKALQLWASQYQKITKGNIINLLSTDVERVYDGASWIFVALSSSYNAIVTIVFLYLDLGWSLLPGLGVVGVVMVASIACSSKYASMRSEIAKATDNRVQVMNEIITSIRVIKMYCWEKPFEDVITKARKDEIYTIMTSGILKGLAYGLVLSAGHAFTATILLTYYAAGHELTVAKVFRTLLFGGMLMGINMARVSQSVQQVGQLLKSLERIEVFLRTEDKNTSQCDRHIDHNPSDNRAAIEAKSAWGSWEDSANTQEKVYNLKDLTFSCDKGCLVAVAGPVGAGKTSLLMHLADEMPTTSGLVNKRGTISYSPQDPWIFQDTVQQNILFGQDMDIGRYRDVLRVCGLNTDVNQMPDGDLTLIGDRGLTLSGGQKARVSLARAIYRDADIYLLDDPLSAVDTKVGRHLFESCIKTFLAGKTRILVTHQIQHLSEVDMIILLRQGTISFVGSYDEMSRSVDNVSTVIPCAIELEETKCDARLKASTEKGTELAEQMDKKAVGDVGWSVYMKFIRAGGVWFFTACLSLMLVIQAVSLSTTWYLSEWAGVIDPGTNHSASIEEAERLRYTYIYLTVASIVVCSVTLVPFWICLPLAAKNLHNTMFHRVMRAPTRFYDVNPVGIVLNRFSRDMGFVDMMLPAYLMFFLMLFIRTVGETCVVCLVLPWLFLAVPIVAIALYGIYRYHVRGIRDLKRLEATSRSPVYSHLSETLSGFQSIRILKMEDDFQFRFNRYQDEHTMRWLMYITAFRMFALSASLLAATFISLVIILALFLKGEISAGLLGLGLTYMLNLLEPFEFQFRAAAQVENFMVSVERILDYNNIEQEAAATSEYRPPDNWPESGSIQIQNMSLYYYEGAPAALQDISVNIQPNYKIGIVGRTGSGKSSLVQSLMRLTEPCGQIYIDGVDIQNIGLMDLREKISVIPQDPVLFSGTMRRNLDPMFRASEDEMWTALRKVQLADKVRSMAGGLDAEIYEGGFNLSTGERQLVCLARALLQENKILILDEATANVDQDTDQVIQATIRLYFRHCTVLIIAHRLNTIMDCNKVMVLDQGKLVEYGVPYLLLQNTEGLFYKYAQQTGDLNFLTLQEIAQEAFVNRLS